MREAEARPPQVGLSDPLAASWRPLRAQLFLPAASPGRTLGRLQVPTTSQASRWPLQAQLLPSDGICRPQMASGQWAPLGPAWASRRPLQAQVVLKSAWKWAWKSSKSASLGPAPSSRRPLQVQNFLESASPGPAPPASQWPLSAQPSSWLSAAFPGPAFDFWQPLQAQNLISSRPLQAQPPASRRPARARPRPRPHSRLSTPS
nr:putative uncharacterized protein FLJ44672 [Pan paniscus]